MHANLASVNTSSGPVTVIRPFVPEPGCPAVKFGTGVDNLVARQAVHSVRPLGALNNVAFWEAEWVTCPLDVPHSATRDNRGL